jgi:anaerobic selenocysteine-containing dehydrogenase
VGERSETISWAQAFAEIGDRTRGHPSHADAKAAGLYVGNPNAHSYGNTLTSGDLKRALKTRNVFRPARSTRCRHQVVNLRLYGHSGLWAIPDIDRTQTMIIPGGNPMASNGSVWTVPDFKARAKALQARGGQLIVIDPRRSETGKDRRPPHLHPAGQRCVHADRAAQGAAAPRHCAACTRAKSGRLARGTGGVRRAGLP